MGVTNYCFEGINNEMGKYEVREKIKKIFLISIVVFCVIIMGIGLYKFIFLEGKVSYFLLALIPLVVAISLVDYIFFNPVAGIHVPIATNKQLDKRINSISGLIQKAENSIFIFSGNFYHKTYNSKKVLSALNVISQKIKDGAIKTKFYIEKNEIDPQSTEFIKFLQEHKIDVYSVQFKAKRCKHLCIIDDRHTRLEISENFKKEERFAQILFDDERQAYEAMRVFKSRVDTKNMKKVVLS